MTLEASIEANDTIQTKRGWDEPRIAGGEAIAAVLRTEEMKVRIEPEVELEIPHTIRFSED